MHLGAAVEGRQQKMVDSTSCLFILEAFESQNIFSRAAVGCVFAKAYYWLAAERREEPHLPVPRASSVNLISPITYLVNLFEPPW